MKTTLILSCMAVVLTAVAGIAQIPPAHLAGALADDGPQAIYADDPQDS